HQIFDGRYRWSILIPGHGGAPLGLATLNITSLPWPLKSSMDFAEHPAHYQSAKNHGRYGMAKL
ncbi:hypothetical protein, partial [Sphingobium chlorophenolicum]|uniref:hypothetical protein n=1 Tax=Sphingobium chlorophenolicum TaxID=46429 RepID=UPI001BDD46B1